MRLNLLGHSWAYWDGYGRYCAYLLKALRRSGVTVTPHMIGAANAPQWLLDEWGVDWRVPTISCLPPFYLRVMPKQRGPHWLITMTEGSVCPDGWVEAINKAGVDRVIVPCEWNAQAFRDAGLDCPVSVIHGGTDPDEFPILQRERDPDQPYTFLALADRGNRKGWDEVYRAFYQAFGGKTTGDMDVRLIVKSRPDGNELINDWIAKIPGLDQRIVFDRGDYADIRDLYAQVDCFAIPSRAEGWGMPHREAAMMGLPVITQAYSGMDDGHTHEWAMVVEGGSIEPIPDQPAKGEVIGGIIKQNPKSNGWMGTGKWRVCDVDELAAKMRVLYDRPDVGVKFGAKAAQWLRANQTWDHTAAALLQLLQQTGVLEREKVLA